jgi:hypothetical protein
LKAASVTAMPLSQIEKAWTRTHLRGTRLVIIRLTPTGDPMNKLISTLHDATHLVPGVPTHSDTPVTQRPQRSPISSRLRNSSPRAQKPNRHHQAPPRVFISWQNWISRLVGYDHE